MTARVVGVLFGVCMDFRSATSTTRKAPIAFLAKPEPDVIFASLDVFGAKPEECLFVGDSAADMEAGRRAGVKTCAVLWGYGQREELLKWSPDYLIERPEQLLTEPSSAAT